MKHDVRLMRKRGKDISKLVAVLDVLSSGAALPPKCKDHQLTGNLHDFRKCHIEPDWLLMYQVLRTSSSFLPLHQEHIPICSADRRGKPRPVELENKRLCSEKTMPRSLRAVAGSKQAVTI